MRMLIAVALQSFWHCAAVHSLWHYICKKTLNCCEKTYEQLPKEHCVLLISLNTVQGVVGLGAF